MATSAFRRIRAWHALAILAAGPFVGGLAAGQSVPEPFRSEPMTSLARHIEPGLAGTMPEGAFLKHEVVAAGDPGRAAIQATVANRGPSAVSMPRVDVLAWNIRVGDGQDALRYRPLAHTNDVWYGSTYWTGPDWTRVGKDWHHPGENTPAVRRFVVPRDGRLSIAGRVAKYHVDKNTDGVRVSIRHNAREIWHAEIAGGDDQGVEPNLTLEVRKGDALRFVVHKRGLIYCDTTRWDPVLRYADGETFQASKAFSTKSQGDGGWSYEMETDGRTSGGLPRVYALGKDLALRVLSPEPNQPAVLDDRGALPLIVVADGPDQSGIALAMSPSTPWRFSAEWTSEGRLALRWQLGDAAKPWTLRPGATLRLPALVAMAYRGTWLNGLCALEQAVSREAAAGFGDLQAALVAGLRHAAGPLSPSPGPVRLPELGLWLLVQADWRQQDRIVETPESYAQAANRHLAKTRTLLADLRHGRPAEFLTAEAAELDRLDEAAQRPGRSLDEHRDLWRRVRSLKRRVALANPLMGFGSLLFAKRVPTSYSHLVMQYYGWRARAGGGLFVLDEPGWSLRARDITGGKLACG
ncbi:MAG: hypothetical protein NUV77_03640, partial [Thermoguttaceae bacterium]|nr:hypothetical protein [Thermoguttaceae bacterium]